METVFRVVFWSICLCCYTQIVLNRKENSDFILKQELVFSGVTAYALLTVIRSIVYRASQVVGISQIGQELVIAMCMIIGYSAIRFLGRFLLQNKLVKWMYYLVSVTFILVIFIFLLVGNVTREMYFVLYSISFIFSLVVVRMYDDNIEISSNSVWKTRLKFSLPVSIFTGFSLFIYMPSELYLANPNAFRVEYWVFIWPLVLEFIIFVVSYLIITLCFTTTKHYYICNNACLTFTLLSNIQSMILNGTMKNMDGVMQQWNVGTVFVNMVLWIGTFIGVFILCSYMKKKVRNVFKMIGYFGTVIQVISLGILLIVTLPTIKFDNYVLSTEKTFELSSTNNVIVFVLDWFDTQIAEQILAEDRDFFAPLDDFVWYENTTSKYAFTDMSIPYMLSGVEWEVGQLEVEYAKSAPKESDVLETIINEGYTVGLYTEASFVGRDEQQLIENGREAKWSLDIVDELQVMAKTTRYKTYPFLLKKHFFYSDDDIFNMQRTDVAIHNIYNDIPFATLLLEEGVTVNDNNRGAFKFYHLHGPHTSYLMNEKFESEETDMLTQARGSLRIVYEFIEQLKKNKLYENATIIITADHGQNFFDRPSNAEELGLDLVSSPILFVKEAGVDRIAVETSKAPVSHEEFIPTILKAVVGNTKGYGRTFSEVEENEVREREFIYGRHSDIPFVKYVISGDVMNPENWSEPIEISKE